MLADNEKCDVKAVEDIDGVKGVFSASGQVQIILGTGVVNKVYDEFLAVSGLTGASKEEVKAAAKAEAAPAAKKAPTKKTAAKKTTAARKTTRKAPAKKAVKTSVLTPQNSEELEKAFVKGEQPETVNGRVHIKDELPIYLL